MALHSRGTGTYTKISTPSTNTSGTFGFSPENLKLLRTFSISFGTSETSPELFDFLRNIRNFSGTFQFPSEHPKLLRNFSISSGTSETSPELFDFLRNI